MKSIGFIDYYLDEWHANKYPEMIKTACKDMDEKFEVRYAWAELDVSPKTGGTTDEWCKRHGVEKCENIEDVCEKSDFIIILAPSDPDKHLAYCAQAFKCGKNTYVDKTFAPDFDTARKIYELADGYGTKIFSTSALRYATELDSVVGSKAVITSGGGSNLDEYIVHQIEMVVKVVDSSARSVVVRKQGDNQYLCSLELEKAQATMVYAPALPFTVTAEMEGKSVSRKIESDYFVILMKQILEFFLSSEPPFAREQTLEVMKIREGVIKGKQNLGQTIKL